MDTTEVSCGSIWHVIVALLTLAELITSCVFIYLQFGHQGYYAYSGDVTIYGPAFFLAICWFNFWLSHNVFNGQDNRMRNLSVAIIYRLGTVFGNYLFI